MRFIRCTLGLLLLLTCQVQAQIPDGSIAPDFTFTDINGNSQNLYSYLNQGKYVVLDISATWCVPCWAYHNNGIIDSIYNKHDQPGLQDWKVIFMEGDGNTDSADLHGTGTNTQGDWVTGANYTIIDPLAGPDLNNFKNSLAISFYPTFFLICPDKRIFHDTLELNPPLKTWEYVADNVCFPTGIDNLNDKNPVSIYPNPAKDAISIYFGLNIACETKIEIVNLLGSTVASKNYGRLYPGDQVLRYEIPNLQAGLYFVRISAGNTRYVMKKILVQ